MENLGERLQAIEGQLNEIRAVLHQVHPSPGASDPTIAGVPKPPRTKRPPSADKGEQK
jgi:hypothetical protein